MNSSRDPGSGDPGSEESLVEARMTRSDADPGSDHGSRIAFRRPVRHRIPDPGSRIAIARRSPRRVPRGWLQEDQVLHQRERRLWRAGSAGAADAHLVVLADDSGGVMSSLPFAGDDRRDGVVGLAFAMKHIAQLLLMCDGHDIGLSVDGGSLDRTTRTGGMRRRSRSAGRRAEYVHLRQLSRRHRVQPAALRDARPAARADARPDRRMSMRIGMSLVRGARRAIPVRTRSRSPRASSIIFSRRACVMDLSSRLRAIVKSGPPKPGRTWPERARSLSASRQASSPTSRTPAVTNRRWICRRSASCSAAACRTPFGRCLVIDRRYEADRWHGESASASASGRPERLCAGPRSRAWLCRGRYRATIFIDLETTGLSGGAGTVAFLVGCGFFDLGAFQVRQFLLTSYSAERALLAAVAEFFDDADLIVTYNGKTFDVPVMETRWLFHRLQMPLEAYRTSTCCTRARRLWRTRSASR